jgi:hypothetical protein
MQIADQTAGVHCRARECGSVALAVRAQQKLPPTVGFLNSRSQSKGMAIAAAFRQGMHDAGYDGARNVVVEYRWADDQIELLPRLLPTSWRAASP